MDVMDHKDQYIKLKENGIKKRASALFLI